MKKNKLLLLTILSIILIGLLIFFNREVVFDSFWSIIDNQLDYERSQDVGDDFNKIGWGNLTFQINHRKEGNNFEYVNMSDKEVFVLLKTISSYKIAEGNLYIKSNDGFAVVSENNICRIFMTSFHENKVKRHIEEDKYGNKLYYGTKIENSSVQYLTKFKDFSVEERKIFKKMKN